MGCKNYKTILSWRDFLSDLPIPFQIQTAANNRWRNATQKWHNSAAQKHQHQNILLTLTKRIKINFRN